MRLVALHGLGVCRGQSRARPLYRLLETLRDQPSGARRRRSDTRGSAQRGPHAAPSSNGQASGATGASWAEFQRPAAEVVSSVHALVAAAVDARPRRLYVERYRVSWVLTFGLKFFFLFTPPPRRGGAGVGCGVDNYSLWGPSGADALPAVMAVLRAMLAR